MRGHVTLTSAAPGVGKSTLTIEEAVALVAFHNFLNFEVEPMKAVIINNEETRDEIERRIEATCQCFEVPPSAEIILIRVIMRSPNLSLSVVK
jgi:RecA-family ATPase